MQLRRTASDQRRPVRSTSHWIDQIWHSQPRSCAEGCPRERGQTQAHSRRVSWSFLSAPRMTYEFPWQSDANMDLFGDTDFGEFGHSAQHLGEGSHEGIAPQQALEIDGDIQLCRSRTVWNRQRHHRSAWDRECRPRLWPEYDREHTCRFGSSGSARELVSGGSDTSLWSNCGSKELCDEETFVRSKSGVTRTQRTR